jgi:membrane-bound serine protease (ClpP class)
MSRRNRFLGHGRKLLALVAILTGLAGLAGRSFASPSPIYLLTLDDDIINPPVAEYIASGLEEAATEGASLVIIEIDTPGGLLTSTRSIVKAIMNARVPVVAYIAPSGARAGSAGVFITLAANVAAMAPSTNIGAAHPVGLGDDKQDSRESFSESLRKLISGGKDEEAEDAKAREAPPMEQKLLNDTTAWVKAIAEARGRNPAWSIKAVTESVSATDIEAKKLGIVDFIAGNLDELLTKLDGFKVTVDGNEQTLRTRGVPVINYEKGFRLTFLTALAHPNIAYILLMLGFYGLLFEFTNPGIGFPGIAGAFCLVLAFFGLQVLPTNYAGIALIALAIALFVAEVKVTSYGLLTLGGIVSMIFGSLILFRSPHAFMRVSLSLVIAFTVATLAIGVFLMAIAARLQKRRAVTGPEGMAGETGTVQSWTADGGKVFVHGEIWDARGPEGLSPDEEVEVISAQGMKLEVRKKNVTRDT